MSVYASLIGLPSAKVKRVWCWHLNQMSITEGMKHLLLLFAVLLLPLVAVAQTHDSPLKVTLPDGTVATAEDRCAAGDLCGTIGLADGDTLRIYNGGSAKCQPFTLKVLRMHGETTLLSYDLQTRMITKDNDWRLSMSGQNCRFLDSYFVFDKGNISMGVYLNTDGSLGTRFADKTAPSPSP